MSRLSTTLLAAGLLMSAAACSHSQRVKTETAIAEALISDEQEHQLGLQVKNELQKEGIKYLEDPAVNDYVKGVFGRLVKFAEKDREGVEYHVHVIDDAKTVNAFATPGGHLYVYTGLLMAADTEAELAGVLAHEAGHVVGRHSARQMVNAYGLQAVAALALGKNPSLLKQIAAGVTAQGVMLAHGRGEELEADEYAARYTSAAGYDPKGIITFFQKLKAKEPNMPGVLAWLSTHPPTSDRITRLNAYIAQHKLKGSDLGADRLRAVKARIPSPPAAAR